MLVVLQFCFKKNLYLLEIHPEILGDEMIWFLVLASNNTEERCRECTGKLAMS